MTAVLAISGLGHRYGQRQALQQLELTLGAGECCILLGPNGAGKSTLFGLLTRLLAVQQGSIRLFGQTLRPSLLGRVGVVFQQPTLDLDLTVEQNLRYFGALQGLYGKALTQRIDAELERLQLAERRRERVRALNGGHRRRVEIARALLHQPALLLLDEPTVGLDLPTRQQLIAHLHALARDDGLTLLWATHLIDEIDPAYDTLALLHRGQLLAHGPVAPLLAASGRHDLAGWFDHHTGALP